MPKPKAKKSVADTTGTLPRGPRWSCRRRSRVTLVGLALGHRPIHVLYRWMGHSKVELTSKLYGDFAPDHLEQWGYLPTAN